MSKSLVNDATANNQNPPSGYQLQELSKKTLESFDECENIGNLLMKRLGDSSPDVKYKTLAVIKHLCQHGRPDFRVGLQRKTNAIREATFFRGPMDPLRGDVPNQRVRDTAKETMTAIFNAPTQSSAAAPNLAGRMVGFGSGAAGAGADNYSQPRADYQGTYSSGAASGNDGIRNADGGVARLESGAYSTGKMQGFGNPAFSNNNKPGFLDRVADKVNAAVNSGNRQQTPQFRQFESAASYQAAEAAVPAPATAGTAQPRRRGRVGGVWGSEQSVSPSFVPRGGAQAGNVATSSAPSTPQQAAPQHSSASSGRASRIAGVSSGEYESRLVDAITEPTGVKALPSKQELKDFLDKARSINGELLASLLVKKFEADAWQSALKALAVLEAMCKLKNQGVIEYLRADFDDLVELEGAPKKQVAAKASSILVLIGVKDPSEASSSQPQTSSATHAQHAPDLLALDSLTDPPTDASQESKEASDVGGMFSGLSVGGSASPAQKTAAAPQQSGLDLDSFFDGPSDPPQAAQQQVPQQQVAQQRAPTQQSHHDDLLGFMSQPEQPAQVQASSRGPARDPLDSLLAGGTVRQQHQPSGFGGMMDPYQQQQQHQQQQQQQYGHMHGLGGFGQQQQQAQQQNAFGLSMGQQPQQSGFSGFGIGSPPAGAQQNSGFGDLDFTVTAAGNRSGTSAPRRVLDTSPLDNIGKPQAAQPASGFGFVSQQDTFAFVNDHMKAP